MKEEKDQGLFGGLGKDDRKILTEIKDGINRIADELAKPRVVEVRFSLPLSGGLTKAEEDALALKLAKSSGSLQDSIDRNQPKT